MINCDYFDLIKQKNNDYEKIWESKKSPEPGQ